MAPHDHAVAPPGRSRRKGTLLVEAMGIAIACLPMRETDSNHPPAADQDVLARYRELRGLARRLLFAERRDHTLAATDLAHEVWVRLAGADDATRISPEDFRRLAATAMRHVLVDHARTRGSRKRGGGATRLSLDALELAAAGDYDNILAVDEALEQLQEKDPGLANLVRLRFFAGLTVDETAQALGASPRTVDREWNLAKSLLLRLLRQQQA